MRLTTKTIHHYLLEKGFIDSETIINGDYLLTQSQSRNSIFKIRLRGNSGLFIKQLVNVDQQNIYLMQKDATAHYLLLHDEEYTKAAQYIPRYLGYDPQYNILAVEYFAEAKNLHELTFQEKEFSQTYAEQMADILSSFHFNIKNTVAENPSLQFYSKQIPWILNINDLINLEQESNNNPVPKFIKQFSDLCYHIDQVRLLWKFDSLIHGDIKWQNFIITNPDKNMKLIDWEISDIGDPLWDVSGVFQSYLLSWVLSYNNENTGHTQIPEMNFVNPDKMKPAIQTFWKTYMKNQGIDKAKQGSYFDKSMKYTAVRLLQTAFETNSVSADILANSARIIQLSNNILENTEKLAEDLFGIKYCQYESVQ